MGALGPRNREETGAVFIFLLLTQNERRNSKVKTCKDRASHWWKKMTGLEISGSPGDNQPFRIQKDQFTVFVVFCCFVSFFDVLDAVTNVSKAPQ